MGAFDEGFMRGFNFVDSIHENKRRREWEDYQRNRIRETDARDDQNKIDAANIQADISTRLGAQQGEPVDLSAEISALGAERAVQLNSDPGIQAALAPGRNTPPGTSRKLTGDVAPAPNGGAAPVVAQIDNSTGKVISAGVMTDGGGSAPDENVTVLPGAQTRDRLSQMAADDPNTAEYNRLAAIRDEARAILEQRKREALGHQTLSGDSASGAGHMTNIGGDPVIRDNAPIFSGEVPIHPMVLEAEKLEKQVAAAQARDKERGGAVSENRQRSYDQRLQRAAELREEASQDVDFPRNRSANDPNFRADRAARRFVEAQDALAIAESNLAAVKNKGVVPDKLFDAVQQGVQDAKAKPNALGGKVNATDKERAKAIDSIVGRLNASITAQRGVGLSRDQAANLFRIAAQTPGAVHPKIIDQLSTTGRIGGLSNKEMVDAQLNLLQTMSKLQSDEALRKYYGATAEAAVLKQRTAAYKAMKEDQKDPTELYKDMVDLIGEEAKLAQQHYDMYVRGDPDQEQLFDGDYSLGHFISDVRNTAAAVGTRSAMILQSGHLHAATRLRAEDRESPEDDDIRPKSLVPYMIVAADGATHAGQLEDKLYKQYLHPYKRQLGPNGEPNDRELVLYVQTLSAMRRRIPEAIGSGLTYDMEKWAMDAVRMYGNRIAQDPASLPYIVDRVRANLEAQNRIRPANNE